MAASKIRIWVRIHQPSLEHCWSYSKEFSKFEVITTSDCLSQLVSLANTVDQHQTADNLYSGLGSLLVYLNLSSIYTHFNTLKKKALGKHCGKR